MPPHGRDQTLVSVRATLLAVAQGRKTGLELVLVASHGAQVASVEQGGLRPIVGHGGVHLSQVDPRNLTRSNGVGLVQPVRGCRYTVLMVSL